MPEFEPGPAISADIGVADLKITPRDIAMSFNETVAAQCDAYTTVRRLHAEGLDKRAIIKKLREDGVERSTASNRHRNWVDQNKEPHPVRCVNDLVRLGVFRVEEGAIFDLDHIKGFNHKSPLFEAVNLLAYLSHIFSQMFSSSGKSTADMQFIKASLDKEIFRLIKALDKRAKSAGIGGGAYTVYEQGRADRERISLGRYLVRLIALWNGAQGSFPVPPSIQAAVNTLEKIQKDPKQLNDAAKKREAFAAYTMIHQFVMLFWTQRCRFSDNPNVLRSDSSLVLAGSFPSTKTSDARDIQIELMGRVFSCLAEAPAGFGGPYIRRGQNPSEKSPYVYRAVLCFPDASAFDLLSAQSRLRQFVSEAIAAMEH